MAAWDRAPPIVFITGHGDIPMTVRAIKAGAVEFLPKPFADADLLAAIHQGLEKDRQAVQQREDVAAVRERHATLTPRELALMLQGQGLRNKQTADRLGISEVTVRCTAITSWRRCGQGSVALVAMVNRWDDDRFQEVRPRSGLGPQRWGQSWPSR